MRITELLKSSSIALNTAPRDKEDAIRKLADLMETSGNLSDKEAYVKDVLIREAAGSTGLGDGIATPHAKSKGVKAAGLAAMTVPGGVDFDSLDGNPARIFFLIASAGTEQAGYSHHGQRFQGSPDQGPVRRGIPQAHRRQGRWPFPACSGSCSGVLLR